MRISATLLESYRLFTEQDWMTQEMFEASIRGEVVRTDAMRLGTAFHAVLETPDAYRVPFGFACDGFSFPDATMQPALALIDRRGTFEVKATIELAGHTVVARADYLLGTTIAEHKTTTGQYDVDKYLPSLQWRVEAAIFAPSAITYRTFVLEEPREGIVGLKSIEMLTVYPYPEVTRDVAAWVRRLAEYVERRGLTSYLERSHEVVAA